MSFVNKKNNFSVLTVARTSDKLLVKGSSDMSICSHMLKSGCCCKKKQEETMKRVVSNVALNSVLIARAGLFQDLLLGFLSSLCYAQEWVVRYNGPGNREDVARAIAVDVAGNVYVTGASYGSGTEGDYATIKYNSAGVQQWVARYNGPGNSWDEAWAIAVDESGNVYVTGMSYGSGTEGDYATIKYNSVGVQQWVARYNGPGNYHDAASAIAVDGAGNVYVTGTSYGSDTDYDYATIKYNSVGVQQWVARYNGPGDSTDGAHGIAVDVSGSVYVAGASYGGSSTGNDYATIKYNSAGDTLWVRRYNEPGNGNDYAHAIAVDVSGNVYVTGTTLGPGTDYDYMTMKYNSAGDSVWVKRYNGPVNGDDRASAIAVDDSGNVYVTGESMGSSTNYDYATIKYNPAGDTVWVRRYNGPGNFWDAAWAIAVDGSGNIYVTGESKGSGTSDDYATIEYNPAGNTVGVARYNGPVNGADRASAIAVDDSGNVYVTGMSYGSGTDYDYATIKYCGLGGVDEDVRLKLPESNSLKVYPNPALQVARIMCQVASKGMVRLEVYDISGKLVRTIYSGEQEKGCYEMRIHTDSHGVEDQNFEPLPAGIYFIKFQAGKYKEIKKIVLVR